MAGPALRSARTESEPRVEPEKALRPEEDHWDEPELPEHRERTELELLQGPWLSVSGRREAQFLIAGGHFTVRFKDGEIYMGVFELDGTGQPKMIAMHIHEGPGHHKGKTALCIYELAGDTLRWCANEPGRKEQLTAFPAETDPKYLCLVLRRETGV